MLLEDRRAAKGLIWALVHFSRAGFTLPVLHEGNESQRGWVSRPCPHCWLAGWVAELASRPDLTWCPHSNHQVALGTVGWPGGGHRGLSTALTSENGHEGFLRRPAWQAAGAGGRRRHEAACSPQRLAFLHTRLQTASTGKGTSEHN